MDAPISDLLHQLRDIHLPAEPSWWPPAPGWWLLYGFTVALAAFAIAVWDKRRRRRLPFKVALQLIDDARHRWRRERTRDAGADAHMVNAVAEVVRRVQLVSRPLDVGVVGAALEPVFANLPPADRHLLVSVLTEQRFRAAPLNVDGIALHQAVRKWVQQEAADSRIPMFGDRGTVGTHVNAGSASS